MRDWTEHYLEWNEAFKRKPIRRRLSALPREIPEIEIEALKGKPIREKAVALRERYSARDIGKALGITRNAVIGHWHRAQLALQIAGGA